MKSICFFNDQYYLIKSDMKDECYFDTTSSIKESVDTILSTETKSIDYNIRKVDSVFDTKNNTERYNNMIDYLTEEGVKSIKLLDDQLQLLISYTITDVNDHVVKSGTLGLGNINSDVFMLNKPKGSNLTYVVSKDVTSRININIPEFSSYGLIGNRNNYPLTFIINKIIVRGKITGEVKYVDENTLYDDERLIENDLHHRICINYSNHFNPHESYIPAIVDSHNGNYIYNFNTAEYTDILELDVDNIRPICVDKNIKTVSINLSVLLDRFITCDSYNDIYDIVLKNGKPVEEDEELDDIGKESSSLESDTHTQDTETVVDDHNA